MGVVQMAPFPLPARAPAQGGIAVRESVRRLHPAYFAMVMATGIVSVAAQLLGWPAIASALLVVNVVAFPALWGLTLLRVLVHPREVAADLFDHQRGVGFFTAVAAASVLGVQCVVLRRAYDLAFALWILAIALWLFLVYAVFAALTVKAQKPTLAEGISGGWLVAVVATESIANLGALLLPAFGSHREPLLFFSLVFWLCGGMLYIWMISLIFYRYTFFSLEPTDLMPPYWVNMGAMAISALAGTTLIANAGHSALLVRMLPFLYGFTTLFWATATWWIPMLVILAVWRHGYRRLPVAYDPLYWGAVFPIGMYAVSTQRLAQTLELPFLLVVPPVFLAVALVMWALTFTGLLRQMVRSLRAIGAARVVAVLAPVLLLCGCEPTNQGYAPEQPIKYSHAVHAGGLQIPCQYCHTAAESSRHAGIPPASTCLNCHGDKRAIPDHPEVRKVRAAVEKGEPIRWVKVHNLPDHVYFDHSAHVGAGVACQTCHGPVEAMGRVTQQTPLTMGWCLDCHRQGSAGRPGVAPVSAGRSNALTDCAVCHH